MGVGWDRAPNRRAAGQPSAVIFALAVVAAVVLPIAASGPAGAVGSYRAVSLVHHVGSEPQAQTPSETTLTGLAPDPDLHVVGNSLEDASGQQVRLLGVDATGTEDACIQDRGFSWGPFDAAEAASIAAWHANAVRVPLNEDCWLGINGSPARYSGAAYQAAIEGWVTELNAAGLVAILDLHWSAPGTIVAAKQWQMPDATHSITFWSQVASAFKGDPLVVFDLFNEPFLGGRTPDASDWACWRNGCSSTVQDCVTPTNPARCTNVTYQVAGMQQLVDAVRSAGADQPLMVGGLGWASTPCNHGRGGTCNWITYEPVDPIHQLVASFHVYYDHTDCDTLSCWTTTLAPLAEKVPVVTGELGEKTCTATFVQQYIQWADAHGVSYLLWAWQPATTVNTLACGPQRLLSNWSGAPNGLNPVGPMFLSHLSKGLAVRI